MKIPFGYGHCYIEFSGNTMPNGIPVGFYFKVDHNSTYNVEEISEMWTTLTNNNSKYVYGYHFYFDLKLYDNNLQSGSQDYLNEFLYYYNINTTTNKRFLIYPFAGDFNGFEDRFKIKYEVIALEYPSLSNIFSHKGNGQYLNLKLKTTTMRSRTEFNYLIYRNTTNGSWGKYPSTQTPYLKLSSSYSRGMSFGTAHT